MFEKETVDKPSTDDEFDDELITEVCRRRLSVHPHRKYLACFI